METWVNGRATNLRNYRMTANQIKDPCEVSGHEFKAPSILDWEFFLPQYSCAQVQMCRMERMSLAQTGDLNHKAREFRS